MEKLASIFCHIPNGMLKDEARRELRRQHDRLAQRQPGWDEPLSTASSM